MLNHLREGKSPLTGDEVIATIASQAVAGTRILALIEMSRGALAGFEIRGVSSPDPCLAHAVLECDGRLCDVAVLIEAQEPYGIRSFQRAERVPGITIRDAAPADAPALRALEQQVPIVMGDAEVVYDRGDDYFAAERLMGDAVTHIVEMDGRPVGLASWVAHEIRIHGRTITGSFKHRQRLLPEARGQGVRQMQDFCGFKAQWRTRDTFYTYASAANATVRRAYGEPGWQIEPERIVIDTQRHTGADAGRSATTADSERIIALLNGTHDHEEMYLPYTAASLAERLGREPAAYSWPQFRLGERALVGVWPAHLGVIYTNGGLTTTDDRALVLDFGYERGAEDEFVALLQAECAALARSGHTELAIFVGRQSSAYEAVAAMAKRIDPYLLYLGGMPPPADLAERGVYVDQLYF